MLEEFEEIIVWRKTATSESSLFCEDGIEALARDKAVRCVSDAFNTYSSVEVSIYRAADRKSVV